MNSAKQKIRIRFEDGREVIRERQAVASIDSKECVNCGTCRRVCPTEAVQEYQREICRLCPDCADGPMLFPYDAADYFTQHSCSIACPLGTVPEGYVSLIAEERFAEAYDLICELNPLPQVCGRICHHPCEQECKRGLLIDEPIAIRSLKRFVTENATPKRDKFVQRYDTKVAVVGAGPAGITAAFDLAKKGYRVVVFEAGPEPGGMMRKGVPDFRLDKDTLRSEIRQLEEAGIKIMYNTIVGKNPSIDDLLEDGFAAVLIAVGASKGIILPIDGIGAEQVYDALSFMERVNAGTPVEIGKKAVVIGAGSVAIDTARTLLRVGAEEATCVCIESEEMIPAPISEVMDAKDEGVKFVTDAAPTEISAEWVTVEEVEFTKVKNVDVDEYGRLMPVTVEGSEFTLEADTVVFAVGQRPDVSILAKESGLQLDGASRIIYDEATLMTSKDRVFVAGDVVAARGSVIEAMASGRKAALAIDNLITGRELEEREHRLGLAETREKILPAQLEKLSSQPIPKLRHRDTNEEVELAFTAKEAVLEAKRCMKCGFERVDDTKCIGCGVCVELCPKHAISLVQINVEEGQ